MKNKKLKEILDNLRILDCIYKGKRWTARDEFYFGVGVCRKGKVKEIQIANYNNLDSKTYGSELRVIDETYAVNIEQCHKNTDEKEKTMEEIESLIDDKIHKYHKTYHAFNNE